MNYLSILSSVFWLWKQHIKASLETLKQELQSPSSVLFYQRDEKVTLRLSTCIISRAHIGKSAPSMEQNRSINYDTLMQQKKCQLEKMYANTFNESGYWLPWKQENSYWIYSMTVWKFQTFINALKITKKYKLSGNIHIEWWLPQNTVLISQFPSLTFYRSWRTWTTKSKHVCTSSLHADSSCGSPY